MEIIKPTSKQELLIEAALSEKYSMILFGGAVGGAKTFGLYMLALIAQRVFPGIQIYFVRKDLATIERNSYATWNEMVGKFGTPKSVKTDRRSDTKNPRIEFKNGANLIFFGENYDKDKELTRWSGLIPNWFFADEINELQYKSYTKMFERAGRYQLPGKNPKPLIVATCNPSHSWVKEYIYDKWINGTLPKHILYIPSKVTDNPNLPQAYLDNLKNLPRYEYEVYVEGNWDVQLKTGGEFLKGFELNKHVKYIYHEPDKMLHISIDSNVYPYIAISIFQLEKKDDKWIIKLVHEIPAKDPNNTAKRAAELTANWINSIGYELGKIYLYGDRSTKNRNNIDDNKRSFAQIFMVTLINCNIRVEDKFASMAPPVAALGDFVNAIFDGTLKWGEIVINETCKTAIGDYIETKTDKDGSILKSRITDPITNVSYEKTGHYCFVGETMILTDKGYKRIDSLKVGEKVLTRNGYKKIKRVFNNGLKEVNTYKIGNYKITCTQDHKIWTLENGFIPVSHIKTYKIFCIYNNIKNEICLEKQLITKDTNFIDIQNQKKEQKEFIFQEEYEYLERVKRLDFMYINGLLRKVKFLMDMLYIMLTIIHLIMIYQIYNALKEAFIKVNTCCKKIIGKGQEKICLRLHMKQQKNGINQKKVENGIKNIYKKLLIIYLLLDKYVRNVALNLKQNTKEEKIKNIFVAKTINGNIKREYKGIIDQKYLNAKHAEKKFTDNYTAQQNAIMREVYNIEVEEQHEYFANGILVSNCDTLKDFIYQAFTDKYNEFQNRFKIKTGGLKVVNIKNTQRIG